MPVPGQRRLNREQPEITFCCHRLQPLIQSLSTDLPTTSVDSARRHAASQLPANTEQSHQNPESTAKASPEGIPVGAQRGQGNAKRSEETDNDLFSSAFLCENFAFLAALRWMFRFDAIALPTNT